MHCAALIEMSWRGVGGGGEWQNQWHLSCALLIPPSLVSQFSVGPSGTRSPLAYFSSSFPLLCIDFLSLLSFLLFFDTFWHHLHSDFGPKRAQKRDRWRDETERSRRQMEGEREDGRRRKEQSLLFLAAGRFYFILLYNWYSFYITIAVAPWHWT